MKDRIRVGGEGILALVFAAERRPTLGSLAELIGQDHINQHISLSNQAPAEAGWAELLVQGLTFDCLGLAPGKPAPSPPEGALLGLESRPSGPAVVLQLAPHLAGAGGMVPVVRVLAGLGAELAKLDGVEAVCWQPACSWMAPAFYRKVIADWLEGGPFPAPGLTSLHREPDGSMVSVGLDFMIGQELCFASQSGPRPAPMTRIGTRLISTLVEKGPLSSPQEFTGPAGERVQAVPIRKGQLLRIELMQ